MTFERLHYFGGTWPVRFPSFWSEGRVQETHSPSLGIDDECVITDASAFQPPSPILRGPEGAPSWPVTLAEQAGTCSRWFHVWDPTPQNLVAASWRTLRRPAPGQALSGTWLG